MLKEPVTSNATRSFTPREIVGELDRYIVGQHKAKRAVAIALRNRWRRQQVSGELGEEIAPKNIIMIGATGVGKTEVARRLARLAQAPFIKVEASKFTEVGYVGRDVESMIRDLLELAIQMVRKEHMEMVQSKAEKHAIDKLSELIAQQRLRRDDATEAAEKSTSASSAPADSDEGVKAPAPPASPHAAMPHVPHATMPDFSAIPGLANIPGLSNMLGPFVVQENTSQGAAPFSHTKGGQAEASQSKKDIPAEVLEGVRSDLLKGVLDSEIVEIDVATSGGHPFMTVLGAQGNEDLELNLREMFSNIPGAAGKTKRRRMTVSEAREQLKKEEAEKLIDHERVQRDAIERTEQSGIVFLDEIDKVARQAQGTSGADVSREGVQRDLLPIIEGSTVNTKHGSVKTDHILFVAAGAFHVSKVSDLIPELQGRFPIRVELESLKREDFERILREPKNALTKQYEALLKTEGVQITFSDDAIAALATYAATANELSENIGARRLHTIMEALLDEISFTASERSGETIAIDEAFVNTVLGPIVENRELARFVL